MSKRYVLTATLEIIDDVRPMYTSEQKQTCYDPKTISKLCFGMGLILESRAKDKIYNEES